MIPALKKDRPAAAAGPTPAALVARVAAASSEFLDADPREREPVALRSAAIFDEVFDACRSNRALTALDREASAGFPAWIPDTAFDLASFGRGREAVALLERLAATLGYPPFSPELLTGMLKGMRRWHTRDGEFEIDLPAGELAPLVACLLSEANTFTRLEELSSLLGRRVEEWHAHAAELLAEAGPVALGAGTTFVTVPFALGEECGWMPMPKLPRLGRNSPCLCGSGKKLKRCCGRAGDPHPYNLSSSPSLFSKLSTTSAGPATAASPPAPSSTPNR